MERLVPHPQQQQHHFPTDLSNESYADLDNGERQHHYRQHHDVLKHHRSSLEPMNTSSTYSSSTFSSSSRTSSSSLTLARHLLYVSHTMAQFSEGAWQFCLILFLAAFSNYQSLFLVSTYGLVNGLMVCSLGGVAGRHVDASHRLRVAQEFIWTENTCVVLATVCCYLLLGRQQQEQLQQQQKETEISNLILNQTTTTLPEPPSLSGFQTVPHDAISLTLLALIHVLGAVAAVLDLGFSVAMERDWIVVMSRHPSVVMAHDNNNDDNDGDNKEAVAHSSRDSGSSSSSSSAKWLSQTNVAMTQIDLSCKIIAPAMAGFFVSWWNHPASGNSDMNAGGTINTTTTSGLASSPPHADLRGAALFVGAINVAALIMEYLCTKKIYHLIPDLANKEQVAVTGDGNVESEARELEMVQLSSQKGQDDDDDDDTTNTAKALSSQPSETPLWGKRFGLPYGLRVYLQQPTALGGIGLSLLYLNVLSFGGIMTAYLVWRGMKLDTVGIWRGVACAIGLLGTLAYHTSVKYLRLETTALWSIISQFTCLSISYASLWVDDYELSLAILMFGVCASRIGLWVYDIAITQLMQLQVPDDVRGVVGGVQQSLNAFFDLMTFGIGLILPDPRQFYVYVAAGYASVGIAMLLYGYDFARKTSSSTKYSRVAASTSEDDIPPPADGADKSVLLT